MIEPQKLPTMQLSKGLILTFWSLLTIGAFWLLFICLNHAGCPFPEIKKEKFFDLGFFALSAFGLIIFLTMTPFQMAETQLSPGFFSRIFNTPKAHFGLYVLIASSILCFLVIAFEQIPFVEKYLNHLFMAIIAAITFAILFHRSWVIRCLYQPYVVYQHIKDLRWEEPAEDVWMELFECTHKAIKQGRFSDAINFIDLMSYVYWECTKKGQNKILTEDLENIYKIAAGEARPVSRFLEEKWPFLKSDKVQA